MTRSNIILINALSLILFLIGVWNLPINIAIAPGTPIPSRWDIFLLLLQARTWYIFLLEILDQPWEVLIAVIILAVIGLDIVLLARAMHRQRIMGGSGRIPK